MQGQVWKYATVIPPNAAFTLTLADIGVCSGGSNGYLVYSRHTFAEAPKPVVFSATQPIAVSARPAGEEIQFWVAAPVLQNGWTILGERSKVVSIAAQRVVSFETIAGGDNKAAVVVELVGAAGESVTLDFAKPDRTVVSAVCGLGRSGRARLTVGSAGNTCEPS
jgi:hypothetical protein